MTLVEYTFETALDDPSIARHFAALTECLEVREITRTTTYLSLDRKTLFALYDGASTQAVALSHHTSSVAFTRCIPVTAIR